MKKIIRGGMLGILLFLLTAGGITVGAVEKTEEAKEIEYVYVDEPSLVLPGIQNIAVGFSDESFVPEEALLRYHSVLSGATYEMPVSVKKAGSLLFVREYEEGDAEDEFVLDGIEYVVDGRIYEAAFSGMERMGYTVLEDPAYEVQTFSHENIVTKVYTSDDTEKMDAQTTDVSAPLEACAGKNVVIVLCAGHDVPHAGAYANGLYEAYLTFRVMQYCRQELSQYSGVTVYTDRDTVNCAYPGQSSGYCLMQRVRDASARGANVFVDFHFNIGGIGGAEVYYPNISYSMELHQEGYLLADKILRQLEALGLPNRGAKIRDCTTNFRDQQGNLEDYYTSINLSKALGMTGIIIEHAYLDNAADAARLGNEQFLQQIGVADAQGIAATYNLTKDGGEDNMHFVDILQDAWYYPALQYVYQNNLMTGLTAVRFAPSAMLCRAQFATIIHRLAGSPETAYVKKFLDVPEGMYFTQPVTWAADETVNILTGYSDGRFGSGEMITREQMVTIMYRYAQYLEADTSARADLEQFPDAENVTKFAREAMQWAVAEGLIEGDQGKLMPQGYTNRAECAVVIMRFREALNTWRKGEK